MSSFTLEPSEEERRRALIARAMQQAQIPQPDTEVGMGSQSSSGLHTRCPHCHEHVEVREETPWSQIQCSSCGSHFGLIDHAQIPLVPGNGRIGPFEIVDFMGCGGFATVWKARDTRLDRYVALKVPRRGSLDLEEREVFLREARSAAQLQHPGIVGMHEVGREGDTIYIVCDLIEGPTLTEWMKRNRLTPREAAALCRDLADALEHAHDKGIVHRDLKPSNILITTIDAAGENRTGIKDCATHGSGAVIAAHIVDFGLAKRNLDAVTVTLDGQIMGTPAYMSPEQAQGRSHEVDGRADIYSLGVILFHLLTGELPFQGDGELILRKVILEDPPAPRSFNSRIPRDLETICLKCLQKDPKRRYATARGLHDDLVRFLEHRPIMARPVGNWEKSLRWCGRNPVSATLVGLVLVVSIVSPLVAWRQMVLIARETAARHAARASQARAVQLAYAFGMNSMQRALVDQNLPQARATLTRFLGDPTSEKLRSFPWYFGWRMAHDRLRSRWRTALRPTCVAASSDQPWVVFGGASGGFYLGDLQTRRVNLVRSPTMVHVETLALSPDGNYVAAAGPDPSQQDFAIELWSVNPPTLLGRFLGHEDVVHKLQFSPDGNELASASSDRSVRRWRIPSGECYQVLTGHGLRARCLDYSPDGTTLVSAGEGEDDLGTQTHELIVWDLAQGKIYVRRDDFPELIRQVQFVDSGNRICVAGIGNTPLVLEASNLKPSMECEPVASSILTIACHGDSVFAAGDRGLIYVWSMTDGKVRGQLAGHDDVVVGIVVHPMTQSLVSVGYDFRIMEWDLTGGLPRKSVTAPVRLGKIHPVDPLNQHVQWSPDGQGLLLARDGGLVTFFPGTQRWSNTLDCDGSVLAISPDGQQVLSESKDPQSPRAIRLYDVSGREREPPHLQLSELARTARFSHSGKHVVLGCGRMANPFERPVDVLLLDTVNLRLWKRLEYHQRGISAVAFSPDDSLLAVASGDRRVAIWDVETGRQVRTFEDFFDRSMGFLRCLEFSPDGATLAGCNHLGELWFWDTQTWDYEPRISRGFFGQALAYSPDSRTLAWGSDRNLHDPHHPQGDIQLWDVPTRELAMTLSIPRGGARGLDFSPDGKSLVTLTDTGEVWLWTAATEHDVRQFSRRDIDLAPAAAASPAETPAARD